VKDASENPKQAKQLRVIGLALSAVFGSSAAGRLFKHGSELVFGLEARTWGFATLALAVICIGGAIAVMVQPDKPQQ
jgi:hypothetical protein